MDDILTKILSAKRARIDAAKRETPFETLMVRARQAACMRGKDAFFNALKKPAGGKIRVIAEIKKASPSRGVIRSADIDVPRLARELEGAGASALSVLAEEDFFLGSPRNVEAAAAAVSVPVLWKDFIYDEYQIATASALGASAVLLIVRMLDFGRLKELFEFARTLNLDVLAETHTPAEISAALNLGARIIGVNSRNLADFSTNFSAAADMMSLIPDGFVRVLESSVENAQMLQKAGLADADAALVGSALMGAENPALELSKLLK